MNVIRRLLPFLLGMVFNLLAHQYGLSQEPLVHFPVSGHTARDMIPPLVVAPIPTAPEHQNRAIVAPLTGDPNAYTCVVAQPGGVYPPGTNICGQVQTITPPPLGRPPIGTIMDVPGLK